MYTGTTRTSEAPRTKDRAAFQQSMLNDVRQWSFRSLVSVHGPMQDALIAVLCLLFAQMPAAVWVDVSQLANTKTFQAITREWSVLSADYLALRSFLLAQALGLAAVGVTTNKTGPRKVWFTKAPAPASSEPLWIHLLSVLRGPPIQAYNSFVTMDKVTSRPGAVAPVFRGQP